MDNNKAGVGPEVLLGIGRLEGRMEQFLSAQTRHETCLDQHDKRITVLENDKTRSLGYRAGIAAVGASLAGAAGFALSHLGSFFK